MPRKPKHQLITRKGFWKRLKSSEAKYSVLQDLQPLLEQPSPPVEQWVLLEPVEQQPLPEQPSPAVEQHLLLEPVEQQPLLEQPASPVEQLVLEPVEQQPLPEQPAVSTETVTTGAQVDLEFAAVDIQVDIKPQMVDVGIQVSLEEISAHGMLDLSATAHLDTVQLDHDISVMESTDEHCEQHDELLEYTLQTHTNDLCTSPDAICENPTHDIDVSNEEVDIQLEATQMNIVTDSTQLEDACTHSAPAIPNRLLESGPSHEASEYAVGFEGLRMCKGNDDEEFLPLVCRHKGVFKDIKGNYKS